jgi:hypothetical protein
MSPGQPSIPAVAPALKPAGKSPSMETTVSLAESSIERFFLAIGVTMRELLYAFCLLIVIGSYKIFGFHAVAYILTFIAGYEISFRVHFGRWRTIFD